MFETAKDVGLTFLNFCPKVKILNGIFYFEKIRQNCPLEGETRTHDALSDSLECNHDRSWFNSGH